jgi:hypothetical protein
VTVALGKPGATAVTSPCRHHFLYET